MGVAGCVPGAAVLPFLLRVGVGVAGCSVAARCGVGARLFRSGCAPIIAGRCVASVIDGGRWVDLVWIGRRCRCGSIGAVGCSVSVDWPWWCVGCSVAAVCWLCGCARLTVCVGRILQHLTRSVLCRSVPVWLAGCRCMVSPSARLFRSCSVSVDWPWWWLLRVGGGRRSDCLPAVAVGVAWCRTLKKKKL